MLALLLFLCAAQVHATDPGAEATPGAPAETTAPADDGAAPANEGAEAVEAVEAVEAAEAAVHPAFPDARPLEGWITPASEHYDLEVMYARQQHTEAIGIAKERLKDDPTNPTLIWMIVRFQFELFEKVDRTDASVNKEAVYANLVEMTDRGLAAHPGEPHLLFAKGLAMARLGTTRGVLSSLFMAAEIEDLWKRSVDSGFVYSSILGAERLPCDVHVAFSVFYRLVPDWWIVQLLAGTRGDLDKAIYHAETANECHGGYAIRGWKNVGLTKMCKGYRTSDPELVEQGVSAIRRYKTIKPRIFTEFIDIDQADSILEGGAKYACEYSRDGQQDLDKSKLDKK